MSLFRIVYTLFALTLYFLFFPFLLFKATQTKYKNAIPAKFWLKNNEPFKSEGIWFHTCSMGETKAIKPLVDVIEEDVNISVITNTGFEAACELSNNVRYLPFELFLPFWIKKQRVLVVMEAELWYMLFLCAKRKGAKTILINARISDKSYSSYKKLSWLYRRIFLNIDKIFAQSELDKQRLESLGARNIEVIGNIKLANLPVVSKEYDKVNEFIITAASTHEGEEELILEAYDKTLGKLIVVPRHPERFDKVDILLNSYAKKMKLTYNRFSKNESFEADIILVDKMGVLINIMNISDAVILGGAFVKVGGHNPIEPAFFGCKIISGEHIFNQKSLFECVNDYNIVKNEELKDVLKNVKNLTNSSLVEIGSIEPIIKEINGNR